MLSSDRAFVFLFGLSAFTALGANVTVLKANGQKAVVKFSDDHVPKNGEKVALNTGEAVLSDSDSAPSGADSGSRAHSIGLNLAFVKPSGDFTMSVGGTFGINMGQIEFGPILNFKKDAATTFGGGAFFDFNFIPNKAPEQFVPGVEVQGTFNLTLVSGNSASVIDVRPSLFGKMFVFKNSVALRAELYFEYLKSSLVSTTAFGLAGGVQAYF